MSNDWQYRPIDWGDGQNSDSGGSLLNQPTQVSASNSSDYQIYQSGEPVAPPPPPDPSSYPFDNPYAAYGASDPFSQPPPQGTTLGGWQAQPFPGSRPRSRARPLIVIPLGMLLVLCAGSLAFGFFAYRIFSGHNPIASLSGSGNGEGNGSNGGPLNITTGAHPTIVIDRNAGVVHITGVQGASKITIQAKGTAYTDRPITYTKSGDGTTFTFNLDNVEAEEVDLNVPATSDLNITTNGDDIIVENVTGQVTLDSNAGAVRATQMSLTGTSTLKTNAGDVTFSGSLATDGTYTFDSNGGNISVTLPASAAFHVEMSTNGGTIHSDFPQVTISGSEAQGNVGQAPYAKVTISSNGGTLTLAKGEIALVPPAWSAGKDAPAGSPGRTRGAGSLPARRG